MTEANDNFKINGRFPHLQLISLGQQLSYTFFFLPSYFEVNLFTTILTTMWLYILNLKEIKNFKFSFNSTQLSGWKISFTYTRSGYLGTKNGKEQMAWCLVSRIDMKRKFLPSCLTSPLQNHHRELLCELPSQGSSVHHFWTVFIFIDNTVLKFYRIKSFHKVTTGEPVTMSL